MTWSFLEGDAGPEGGWRGRFPIRPGKSSGGGCRSKGLANRSRLVRVARVDRSFGFGREPDERCGKEETDCDQPKHVEGGEHQALSFDELREKRGCSLRAKAVCFDRIACEPASMHLAGE